MKKGLIIFVKNKRLQRWVAGLMMASFLTMTSGLGWQSVAWAAEAAQDSQAAVKSGGNNAAAGLVALGLIAALSHRGGDSKAAGTAATADAATGTPTKTSPAPSSSTPSSPASSGSSSSSSSLLAAEQQAVKLMNADRNANGLPSLRVDSRLVSLAENYAQDMINRKFFSHYNPEGLSPFDRMKQAGISYSYAGENLAINTNVDAAEKAFMNSSGHRANILNSHYTDIGIGVRYDSKGSAYVVQEFIAR